MTTEAAERQTAMFILVRFRDERVVHVREFFDPIVWMNSFE